LHSQFAELGQSLGFGRLPTFLRRITAVAYGILRSLSGCPRRPRRMRCEVAEPQRPLREALAVGACAARPVGVGPGLAISIENEPKAGACPIDQDAARNRLGGPLCLDRPVYDALVDQHGAALPGRFPEALHGLLHPFPASWSLRLASKTPARQRPRGPAGFNGVYRTAIEMGAHA
jgi:hypothetical protein